MEPSRRAMRPSASKEIVSVSVVGPLQNLQGEQALKDAVAHYFS